MSSAVRCCGNAVSSAVDCCGNAVSSAVGCSDRRGRHVLHQQIFARRHFGRCARRNRGGSRFRASTPALAPAPTFASALACSWRCARSAPPRIHRGRAGRWAWRSSLRSQVRRRCERHRQRRRRRCPRLGRVMSWRLLLLLFLPLLLLFLLLLLLSLHNYIERQPKQKLSHAGSPLSVPPQPSTSKERPNQNQRRAFIHRYTPPPT